MHYHDPHAANRAKLIEALEHVAHGDRAALREVYDLTSGKLFGICLRICRDRDAAEDVLQDVYLKVWRRAGRFDPTRASPITWLGAIARNTAIDWTRMNNANGVEISDSSRGESEMGFLTSEPGAFETLETAQTRLRLERCLDSLGQKQGGAIRSAFFEGFTYSELAQRLAIPLGTMKSLVRRGLLHLKECLGDAR